MTSPTFVIAREHHAEDDGPGLLHVDAYRLGGLAELTDLDLDAAMAESVTVVEWGDRFVEHLGDDAVLVTIDREPGSDAAPSADPSPAGARRVTVEWPISGRR